LLSHGAARGFSLKWVGAPEHASLLVRVQVSARRAIMARSATRRVRSVSPVVVHSKLRASTVQPTQGSVMSVTSSPAGTTSVALARGVRAPPVGGALVLPVSVKAPHGVLGVVTATSRLPDGRTAVTTRPGTLEDAYSSFDAHLNGELGQLAQGAASASSTRGHAAVKVGIFDISFGCDDPSVERSIHHSIDLSKMRVVANVAIPSPSNGYFGPGVEFELFGHPQLDFGVTFTGLQECHAKAIVTIPIPDTPGLLLEIGPDFKLTANGAVGADLTWEPWVNYGFTRFRGGPNGDEHEFVNGGKVNFSGSAELKLSLELDAGLSLAGRLGIDGSLGPEITGQASAQTSPPKACLAVWADFAAALTAHADLFFKDYTFNLASATFGHLQLYQACANSGGGGGGGGGGGTGGGAGGGEVPKKEEGGGTEKGGGETPKGVWSTRESFDPAFLGSAISCPTSSFCMAVDAGANASIYNGRTWSPPQKISSVTTGSPALDSISCVSEHFCVAAGYRVVVTYENGSWNAPQTIDPSNTWAYLKVSCASETFCVAVDLSGFAWKYTGTWSGAEDVDQGPFVAQNAEGFNGVSCPTTTFCAAVDSQGQSFTYSNGKWGEPTKLNTGRTLSSVSCSSATRCDAVDVGGNVYEYNGGAWGEGVLVDSTLSQNSRPVQISCPSTCVVVDGGGNAFMQAGGKWTGPTEVERATYDPVTSLYNGLNGISCQSATSCVAIDVVGNAFVSSATNKWAATPSIGGGPDHVSCASATTFCAAVDGTGRALTYTSGKWSAPVVIDGTTMINGVSCTTATFCVAVDEFGGALVYNGSSWTHQVIDNTHGISGEPAELVSVSCVSEHYCVAIDHEGTAVIYNNGSWGEPTPIFGSELYREITAISCYSAKFCMVVDGFGEGYVYNGTTWTKTGSVDQSGNGLNSVSCPSEETCIAADGFNEAFHYHGGTWTSEPVGSGENLASVKSLSCPTTGFCVAVGIEGNAFLYNDSAWLGPDKIDPEFANGAPIYPSPSLESVSCSSTTFCMAVDFGGGFVTY